jgi:hypothetical protein
LAGGGRQVRRRRRDLLSRIRTSASAPFVERIPGGSKGVVHVPDQQSELLDDRIMPLWRTAGGLEQDCSGSMDHGVIAGVDDSHGRGIHILRIGVLQVVSVF